MNKSESIKSLAEALAKAQAEFTAVPFNATNPFLKNKYADLGAIIQAAKPVLAKNGLSVSQLAEGEGNTTGITTMLIHSSGEWIASTISLEVSDEKGKSLAQAAGSILTYLRRYSLASILGLYADEDNDGNVVKTPISHSVIDETPAKVIQDSNGKLFSEMDTPELVGHLNAYIKKLKENPDDEITMNKRNEAKMELDSRKDK